MPYPVLLNAGREFSHRGHHIAIVLYCAVIPADVSVGGGATRGTLERLNRSTVSVMPASGVPAVIIVNAQPHLYQYPAEDGALRLECLHSRH